MIANEKAQIFKMLILFKLVYRFNRIPTKISAVCGNRQDDFKNKGSRTVKIEEEQN